MKSIIPKFLIEIDAWLLLNQPRIWSTQIHYAIFSAIVMSPIFFLAGFLSPLLIKVLDVYVVYVFALVGVFLLVMFSWYWITRLFAFSIEGYFGHTQPWWALIEVSLYNICIACLLLPVMVYLFHTQFRIAETFMQPDGSIQRDLAFLADEIDAEFSVVVVGMCEQPAREVIERYSVYDIKDSCLTNLYTSAYKLENIIDFLAEEQMKKLLITYLLLINAGLLIFLGKQGNRYGSNMTPLLPMLGFYAAMFLVAAVWTDMSITEITLSFLGGEGMVLSRSILIVLLLIVAFGLGVLSLKQSKLVYFLPILVAAFTYLLLELLMPNISEIVQIATACASYLPLLPYTKKAVLHEAALPRR